MAQLTLEGQSFRGSMEQEGYAFIPHGISNDAVDELIGAYANFTDSLPNPSLEVIDAMIPPGDNPKILEKQLDNLLYENDSEPEWHKYRTNYPEFAKPAGYTNRSLQTAALQEIRGVAIEDDPKEFYHFHPDSNARMARQHKEKGWGPLPPELVTLNTRFATIHTLASQAVRNTYELLEETHPELVPKHFGPEDVKISPVRLLFYHPGQGEELAGGHYDKAQATLQVAESHLGLRVRNRRTNKMDTIDRSLDLGAFFLGKSWKNDASYPGSTLEPGWHEVANMVNEVRQRELYGQNVARWSIIFFANSLASGTILDKTKTHVER